MRDRSDQTPLRFMKMHGAGNDFVVIDARDRGAPLSADMVRAIGDRHRGVGFDQLSVIEDAPGAGLALTFWNSDGSMSAACGNATRCIAAWEMGRTGRRTLTIRTRRGDLAARMSDGSVWINMGAPITDWERIPLAEPADADHLPIDGDPGATGMGNPHCTFFAEGAEGVDLRSYASFETHPLFPERTNVQVAEVIAPDTIRVRVWERGVGPTLASGSSACAVASLAFRRRLAGRHVRLVLDGGTLEVDLADDGAWMTGPVAHVFDGVLVPEWVEGI